MIKKKIFSGKVHFFFWLKKLHFKYNFRKYHLFYTYVPNSRASFIVLFLPKKSYYTNAVYVLYQVLKILVVIIPELLMNTQGQQRHA